MTGALPLKDGQTMRSKASASVSGVQLQLKIKAKAFHPFGHHIAIPGDELDRSVVDRFEDRVRENGKRVAVKTSRHEFTYDKLNNVANCIAQAINARNSVGPVVVLVEIGALAVASILGVLKAGLAYVHLDPRVPQSSGASRLAELAPTLVLTDEPSLALRASAGPLEYPVLRLESVDLDAVKPNPALSIDPGSPAALLFTSGSTGTPKVLSHDHRSVLRGVRDVTNNLHLCSEDRLLLLATGTAQANSVIFLSLLNGAALLPFDVRKQGIKQLVSWMHEEKITFYRSSATLFRKFVRALNEDEFFPHVRLVRLASETVHKSDIELWKRHFSDDCILVCGLSTTETGPIVEFLMDKETTLETGTVPVGYSMGGAQAIIVDEQGQEVPRGETGEIAVKSKYMATGYLNRPDLTSEVFPTVDEKNNIRLYRTRDIGRMTEDGCVEHLGRKDVRTKIRGYPVQLSQVEKTLLEMDEVETATVTTIARGSHQRLVAYISPASGAAPTVSSLRRALVRSLPEFMVPSAFVIMQEIPIGPSGKVDRAALPDPGAMRPPLDACYAAPENSTQTALVDLWMDVLGVEQIGIHDPFLELGGDSLLAMDLAMRIERRFDVQVPQWKLYECTTPAEMSVLIDRYQLQSAAGTDMDALLTRIDNLSDAQVRDLLSVFDVDSSRET